jgi:hypothetical protein
LANAASIPCDFLASASKVHCPLSIGHQFLAHLRAFNGSFPIVILADRVANSPSILFHITDPTTQPEWISSSTIFLGHTRAFSPSIVYFWPIG